jgi:protease I
VSLTGTKAVILVADMFEDSELIYPLYRLREEDAEVTVAAASKGVVKSKNGYPVEATAAFDEVDPSEMDVVVIPGGFSPDSVRRNEAALQIVRDMNAASKPVAFICHGGWVPISAGILKGRQATAVSAIKDDMVNAGTDFVDAPVVVDGNLISSRVPSDLGPWMKALVGELMSRSATASTSAP